MLNILYHRFTTETVQRTHIVALVLLLLLTTPVGAAQTRPETDNTVTRIAVQADGDARWTVTVRTRLETQAEVRTYRTFQEGVRENESRYLSPFRDRITGVVTAADSESDRTMRAGNFSLQTSIQEVPRRWGVLQYSFTWREFARADDSDIVVDDVFGDGLFIARNDTLVITGPEGYTATGVRPTPTTADGGTVSWRGPRDFGGGDPTVRFVTASTGPASPTPGDGAPATGGSALLVAVAGVLALLAGYAVYRQRADGDEGDGDATIVTDGDRVVQLLEDSGGQLKQTAVAAECDWSASKTSRVLSDLAEEGRVEKLRLGRENVISLPDEE